MSTQADVGRQGKVAAIGIIAILAVIGYIVASYMFVPRATPSSISKISTNEKGSSRQESEQYTDLLNQYNQQNAKKAEATDSTYVSVLSQKENPVEIPEEQPKPPTTIIYNVPKPDYQHEQQRQKEVAVQMDGLVNNWTPVPHASARVSVDSEEYARSFMPVSLANAPTADMANKIKIVDDFAIMPAILQTAIDTDENSVVRAYIPQGKYKGAVLFAMGYRRLSETVDMTFSYMQWQGRSYNITAKAMDQDTMRTALSGEVNNRYFSRIILPALAAGIGRAGQLYEQSGTQNVITPQGGVIQTYPRNPEWRQVTGTVVGGIGRQAGSVLANDAANLPVKQVLVEKNTAIWIQFIGPVLASDDLALGAVPRGAAADKRIDAVGSPAPAPQYHMIVPPTVDYSRVQPEIPGYIPPAE